MKETLDTQYLESAATLTITEDFMPGTTTPALRIDAPAEAARLTFRGPAGRVGGVQWSADRFLVVPIHHTLEYICNLRLFFWEAESGDPAPHARIIMNVFPGFPVSVSFPLVKLDLSVLILPRTPGRMKNFSTGTPLDPAKVSCFAIEIPNTNSPKTLWIGMPYLSDEEPDYKIDAPPVVDELGQWTLKEWAGKTKGAAKAAANLRAWAAEPLPPLDAPFSEYGGWAVRQSQATGYFRTEHDGERWWLIDPLGHPFFSAGIDCIRPDSFGPVESLEHLHAWLPPRDGEFADAWSSDGWHRSTQWSFPTANLIRAFGADWQTEWEKVTKKQLRNWGFNTVAAWSQAGLGPRLQTPYVSFMGRFPSTKATIFRDLPDVFSPEYAASARDCAQGLAAGAEDPLLIGYFLTNEPSWAFGDYNVAEMLLAHPDDLVSKTKFIAFLSDRYEGDAARLANAWRHPVRSFEDLHRPISNAASLSPEALADTKAFTELLTAEYVRVPAEAAKRVDPNHLNLGLRWAWIASDSFYAGAKYCDVFSLNSYKMRPDAEEIGKVSTASGLPVMIGEFHAGALDVGLPGSALFGVATQRDRGKFYSCYVEHAAAIPGLVGTHYFQWMDQPVLGRYDGEALNIGLVDGCHRPYPDLVEAARTTHRRLYDIRAGLLTPTTDEPKPGLSVC